MKYLMIFSLAFSFNIFAQESENKYEPVSNKAEYFFGTFNKGKDLEDLMAVTYTHLTLPTTLQV